MITDSQLDQENSLQLDQGLLEYNRYSANDISGNVEIMLRATIIRLQNYLEYLTAIKGSGRTTVTSEELATVVALSSSRVRQDLIQLRMIGKPRSGYHIRELEILLYAELDLLATKGMALIGFGNLGKALAASGIWEHAGFALTAIFDNDTAVVGNEVNGLTIRHIRELHGVFKSESIVAACLAVPATAAQGIANMLVAAGVRGIWNFTPVNLRVPHDVVVENQHLERGLTVLSCLMRPVKRPSVSEGESKEHDVNHA